MPTVEKKPGNSVTARVKGVINGFAKIADLSALAVGSSKNL